MSRQTQAHLYSELARQELRSRDFKKAAGYVKETLKTFVQHNKFAVERDGIRAVIQTLLPEELFRWLPVRLSLWRCEKHQTSTRYSSDLLDAPSTSSGSLSSRSSDRGSIFDLPEVETGDLSDDTKASVEGLLVKSRHFRQHAESLLAVATTERQPPAETRNQPDQHCKPCSQARADRSIGGGSWHSIPSESSRFHASRFGRARQSTRQICGD